jgi:hypothetical protein
VVLANNARFFYLYRYCIRSSEGRPTLSDANSLVDTFVNARVSKFEPCLPEPLLQELVASVVFDVESARKIISRSW